ncbi:hypothetical protein [Lignipirellula cremea]|uniref:Uncharacterized protein n=1 Tax=Lignipirellula cremea TaxID=2528010 RepID=A0A518DPQ2_9BACT|nr:hypothetical protein [Lignipirellula cremea]QDU93806.1 hypothetical protein Pla8534_15890 [Lignipirellula cremea]
MDFNFFTWIREGVRQSVLLGVSDAVEQIGMPPENAELNQRVASLLETESGSGDSGQKNLPTKKSTPTKRRRLGRSLKELEPSVEGQ